MSCFYDFFQTIIWPPVSADARYLSSWLKAEETIGFEWPDSLSTHGFQFLSRSKNKREPSSAPEIAFALVGKPAFSYILPSTPLPGSAPANAVSNWLFGVKLAHRKTVGSTVPPPPALNALKR